jgi:hypothetical protein
MTSTERGAVKLSDEERKDERPRPDYSMYEAAQKSVMSNEHIHSMVFHDPEYFHSRMRQIQATYKVKQQHWPDSGYGFRIRLIWDHDRLWGTFDLGFFKGVFLIDPGPGQAHFHADDEYDHQHKDDPDPEYEVDDDAEDGEEGKDDEDAQDSGYCQDDENVRPESEIREYPLVWRGTSTQMPDTLFNSQLTVGKIRFGHGEIWGHFDAMLGVGIPNGRCEFHGKQPFGPAVVSLSIQNVIDQWNEHGLFEEDEVLRSAGGPADKQKNETTETSPASSPSDISEQWTGEDQEELLRVFTGIFNITSKAVEGGWSRLSQGLTLRLHVDAQQGKVWGCFDVGIVEGYILLTPSPDGLANNIPMEFRWRGRESETGSPTNGKGEVTFHKNDRMVQGVFRGMCGDIDFKGRRKLMPGGISGYDLDLYRRGWEDYAYGGDSNFYERRSRW